MGQKQKYTGGKYAVSSSSCPMFKTCIYFYSAGYFMCRKEVWYDSVYIFMKRLNVFNWMKICYYPRKKKRQKKNPKKTNKIVQLCSDVYIYIYNGPVEK